MLMASIVHPRVRGSRYQKTRGRITDLGDPVLTPHPCKHHQSHTSAKLIPKVSVNRSLRSRGTISWNGKTSRMLPSNRGRWELAHSDYGT